MTTLKPSFGVDWASHIEVALEALVEKTSEITQVGHEEFEGIHRDDECEWTSQQLAAVLLDSAAACDLRQLRELILLAEDTQFTPEESRKLAPWLLDFAGQRRESEAPEDASVVWAAIRTGASMLAPEEADQLCALLEPGYPIETSLVAVKMIGRIFEAQPPVAIDQHSLLAEKVWEMANSLLNRHVIPQSECAAKALLAIHALAAMASSEILDTVRAVNALEIAWFTRRTRRKLSDLRAVWQKQFRVPEEPMRLLEEAIALLGDA